MIKPIQLLYDDRLYTAEISEIYHPIHWMFHVSFDDGYENIFFSDVESGKWIEQDMGFTPLAELVGKKIESYIPKDNIIRKSVNWYHEENGNKNIHFGYYRFVVDGYSTYEIYADNKRYMFTLVKLNNELWQLFKVPGMAGWNYNEEYIEEIPFIIDTLKF
ncbi:MAG TPA: hypothetical protein VK166_14215 [Chitinophagaceae bacterium]|nr:hypothetical protein [Chitinophagaceae bacterium]